MSDMGGSATNEGNGQLVWFVRFAWFAAFVGFDGGCAEGRGVLLHTNPALIFLSHPVRRV